MLMIAAIAAIMIVPATGFAKTNDTKQDKALVKPLVNKVNTVAKGLATLNRLAATKVSLAATNTAVSILKSGLATAQGNITTLQGNVTSINAQLAAGAAALTSINSALTNSTTGLVGLNAARPQFGVYNSAGVFQGGTGAVSGASGPKANAVGHAAPQLYVIDFGNDVSLRFLEVNSFPGSDGAGIPHAVDCAATGAAATCGQAEGVASDASANHVLVVWGTGGGGTAPAAGFEIAAISG
jgi:hypothetical protein